MSSDENLLKHFSSADKDHSGKISVSELEEAFSATWGYTPPFIQPWTLRLMIGMFDFDHSGKISFEEYKRLVNYVNEWQKIFRNYDRNNTGYIETSELVGAFASFGFNLSPTAMNIIVMRFGRNEGRLTFGAFMQLFLVLQTLTNSFRKYDTQKNGTAQLGYEEYLKMIFDLRA